MSAFADCAACDWRNYAEADGFGWSPPNDCRACGASLVETIDEETFDSTGACALCLVERRVRTIEPETDDRDAYGLALRPSRKQHRVSSLADVRAYVADHPDKSPWSVECAHCSTSFRGRLKALEQWVVEHDCEPLASNYCLSCYRKQVAIFRRLKRSGVVYAGPPAAVKEWEAA